MGLVPQFDIVDNMLLRDYRESPLAKGIWIDRGLAAKRAKELMQTLARMTDGSYFRAQDGQGLLQAYENIDRLERERILSFQYRRYYEGYHWFALGALLCMMLLIALEATIWRRVP